MENDNMLQAFNDAVDARIREFLFPDGKLSQELKAALEECKANYSGSGEKPETGMSDGSESLRNQQNLVGAMGYSDYFEYTRISNNYDPAFFGDWQRQYGRMLDMTLDLNGKKVLDVGCAAGAMVFSFSLQGADAYGCDVNIQGIESSPFPIKNCLKTIESSELARFFQDKRFDIIHSQQVFEHFPGQEYSRKTVQSLYDIMTDNSMAYISLCIGEHLTPAELLEMNRTGTPIDITHINLWPAEFWEGEFSRAGFRNVTEWFAPIIQCYQIEGSLFSYFKEYRWHQYFLQKGGRDLTSVALSRLKALLEIQKPYADTTIYKMIMDEGLCNNKQRAILLEYI